MTPYQLFKEDVKAGLWNDTTYHYNEWLEANHYIPVIPEKTRACIDGQWVNVE